jgi:uncharacterized protein (DUF1684 family)
MSLSLLDWRRRVAALYREVRGEQDPVTGWQLWRAGRDALFRDHPDSPLPEQARPGFAGLSFAGYDPSLRWLLPVEPALPTRLEVATATDGVVPFERIGRVDLPGLGPLDVWWLDSYGGGVFLPLRDATAGSTTYGGGRYLLDTVKGADLGGDRSRLVVDLNFAYNPSCAYDPRWICPLAPASNRLAPAIRGGERFGK